MALAMGSAAAIATSGFTIQPSRTGPPSTGFRRRRGGAMICSAVMNKEKEEQKTGEANAEEVTRKFGLEAGLWKIFTSKDESGGKKVQAKELLARYGGAYLATSISLSAVSFGVCYVLISSGVDVASLLSKVGIQGNETGEKVGTFALAYAAHKAASPIRFPPTVALTPLVASWFGKKSSSETPTTKKDDQNQ